MRLSGPGAIRSVLARVAWTEFVTRPLMMAVTQPTVEGLDRFEAADGPVIFAANHPATWTRPWSLSVLPEPWRHELLLWPRLIISSIPA